MDASYAWHPGNRGISAEWVQSVPLLPDEIFSSWLVRAALAQGCAPLTLTGLVWPGWRPWTIDVDRMVSLERLQKLSRLSGIESMAFQGASLRPIATKIIGLPPDRMKAWSWVLALGARNTKRAGGLQYCPICLIEDRYPYYRIQWRFAWHTGCVHHDCELLDRCGHCGVPLAPHRLLANDTHVAICESCKGDLRLSKGGQWINTARQLQNNADQTLLTGSGIAFGKQLPCTEWFGIISFIIGLVRRANQQKAGALVDFLGKLGVNSKIPSLSIDGDRCRIETMRTCYRQMLLGLTQTLLLIDQFSVAKAAHDAALTKKGFLAEVSSPPNLIAEIAAELEDKVRVPRRHGATTQVGPRPRHVVKAMMKRLERRLRKQQ